VTPRELRLARDARRLAADRCPRCQRPTTGRTRCQRPDGEACRLAELLLTGRPRPKRGITKELNRQRRLLRGLLVLEAGIVGERLPWGCGDSGEQMLLEFANGRAVSVPRSLRHLLGRYVGGGRG
jgi:hypothetical protein